MAFGHTDDVPNAVDPEAQSTSESTSVPPNIKIAQLKKSESKVGLRFG
ncbi:MAG: hypothetical protein ACKVH8_24415 [Pirellulales bacterium]|jgi:hypothetical protein